MQKHSKLNSLLRTLRGNEPVSAGWLRRQGYSSSLVARYVRSDWLESPARGAYLRAGGKADWVGLVHSLQQKEDLRLHPGGRFALAWQGSEHYLHFADPPPLTLYGNDRPPSWVSGLRLKEPVTWEGRSPFATDLPLLTEKTNEQELYEHGLVALQTGMPEETVAISTVERAMLELCAARADTALVLELDALMQALTNLRPDLLQRLLERCTSVQAKRLFLVLAERHAHAWIDRLDLGQIDLGSGKRALVPGGRLDPKYQITLPAELEQALG